MFYSCFLQYYDIFRIYTTNHIVFLWRNIRNIVSSIEFLSNCISINLLFHCFLEIYCKKKALNFQKKSQKKALDFFHLLQKNFGRIFSANSMIRKHWRNCSGILRALLVYLAWEVRLRKTWFENEKVWEDWDRDRRESLHFCRLFSRFDVGKKAVGLMN